MDMEINHLFPSEDEIEIINITYIPEDQIYEDPTQKTLIILNIILALFTLLGNLWLLCFVCGHKKARTSHNVTVVNITVAAIVVSTVVIPTKIGMVLYKGQPGDDVSSNNISDPNYVFTIQENAQLHENVQLHKHSVAIIYNFLK